jgi:putative ABC transport system permease protein
MIKNYFKLALRNIARKKLYTIINLTGLGIASAFCILVYWYVAHERSFDTFHKNLGRLYRVEFSSLNSSREENKTGFFSLLMKDAEQRNMIQTPPIFAGELKKDFPEIEYAIRVEPGYEAKVRVNNQSFKEQENIAYVDEDFFRVFNFPLEKGNPTTVLAGHNSVVLSKQIAIKFFGKADPIGKTLMLPNSDSSLYTVSGIVKDFPVNSSFRYDIIIPRTSVPDYQEDIKKGLNTFSDALIVQLKKGTDAQLFQKKLDAFVKKYFAATLQEWATFPGSELKPDDFHLYLRPFSQAHYNISPGWGHYTDLKNIYQLVSLATIILLIACLNYILLTLTGTVSRSEEVGIRKTVGASRKQIILQFYIETQLVALIAVVIGFALSVICLPVFSNLIGSDLKLEFFSFKTVAGTLCLIAIALGILAGIYPAFVMSGLRPLNMMRKFSAYRLNPYLSKFLIIAQSSACIILIISTLAINKQMRFINQKDLGFDKEQIITVRNPFDWGNLKATYQLRDRLAHFASMEPSIANFTASFLGYNNSNNHLISGEKTMVEAFTVDYNYFPFFKIPIILGRNFSPAIPGDSARLQLTDAEHMQGASAAWQAAIVNETLYNMLGRPVLNEINRELGGPIIGVCKDYYPDDLTKKISPVYHKIAKGFLPFFSFKIKAGQNLPRVMEKIKANWGRLTANEPFSYTFLDETIAKNYQAYFRWMKTVTFSSLLAIIIACMGLFGLSGLTTVARIKEIGIRKVLGASVKDLFVMLNKGTVITALISFIIAVPIALYLVNAWLQNFAYRVHAGWSLFAWGGLISVATALIAVSYHTIKTAITNPVKSLRTE